MFGGGGDAQNGGRGGCGVGARLAIALVIAGGSVCTYLSQRQTNPITGKTQSVALTPDQETALGLKTAPEMERQYGGDDPDPRLQTGMAGLGERIVAKSDARKAPYKYGFHLLADGKTVNAFALPGGQVFVTRALFDRLENEAMLAGVLGHEIGHVVARHSAQQLAKQRLTAGLAGAAGVATTDPNDPGSYRNAAIASAVGQLVNLRNSREDELEADALGVRFMAQAGYDPRNMILVMNVLERSGGGANGPEWTSTHPNPGNRRQRIEEEIRKLETRR